MIPKKKVLLVAALVLFLIVLTIFALSPFSKKTTKLQTSTPQIEKPERVKQTESKWQEKGVAIAGKYADAEVVDLGNGQYRMYYSIEPEVPGNNLEIYSSTSADGVHWTKEAGTRKR